MDLTPTTEGESTAFSFRQMEQGKRIDKTLSLMHRVGDAQIVVLHSAVLLVYSPQPCPAFASPSETAMTRPSTTPCSGWFNHDHRPIRHQRQPSVHAAAEDGEKGEGGKCAVEAASVEERKLM